MLGILLSKDLRRAGRNPGPYLTMLALPLAITALIGLAFGPSSASGPPQIKMAFVDEDRGLLGKLLASAFAQGQLAEMIVLEPMDWESAQARINDNRYSAVLRVPAGFSDRFFDGAAAPPLEVVKNPAERYLPAIVEEIARVMTEALSAISRNFAGELREVRDMAQADRMPEPLTIAAFSQKIAARLQSAEPYLFPPLISYRETVRERESERAGVGNVFAFLLPAVSALFLLFIADTAGRDLFKESELKTLDRYRTLRYNLFPLIFGKTLFTAAIVLLAAAILFLGGGLAFGVSWRQPPASAILVTAYCFFSAGFVALLTALLGNERRAGAINGLAFMAIGFLGGSFIQADSLPAFVARNISPLTPNYWFIQAVNRVQFGVAGPAWTIVAAGLLASGLAAAAAATAIWHRRLAKGARP